MINQTNGKSNPEIPNNIKTSTAKVYHGRRPRKDASFLSRLFFTYVEPFIEVGSGEDLTIEHFGRIDEDDSVGRVASRLEQNWKEQCEREPDS